MAVAKEQQLALWDYKWKIKFWKIPNLIMLYVISLGILQILASLFGEETSLQTPMVLAIYLGVVNILVPLMTLSSDSFSDFISSRQTFLTLLLIVAFLTLTPLVAPNVIPAVFSIF